MGLFDFLFKKKAQPVAYKVNVVVPQPDSQPAQDQAYAQLAVVIKETPDTEYTDYLEDAEVALGVVMPRAFAKHWDQIKKTKMSCITVLAALSDDLKLTQSKFGHYPYMPAGYAYPKDSKGNYMYPLAQINFSEMPPLAGYPTSGYLQFYISASDNVHGLDFDDMQSQKNFRVLYFEEDAIGEPMKDFSFLDEAMSSDMLPLNQPHVLTFEARDEFIGIGDIRCEQRMKEFNIDDVIADHPQIISELENYMYDHFLSNGHKIGGYAYFTQEDPRGGSDLDDYILLLQIDSDKNIMWGDVGVANFFIHPDDLARKDFSKVMYSWDCG